MSKHLVKCKICGETFDANIEPNLKIKNRYVHKSCYEAAESQKTEEEREYELLIEYIKRLFNIQTLNVKINKQIKDYIENKGYSYKGIRKTLQYWFDIKGNSLEKANGGIGIVPYKYEQALTYWKAVWEAQQYNKQTTITEIVIPTREVHIAPPQRKPMKVTRRLFTFLEEEGDNND